MTDPLHPELAPEARRELFVRGVELFNRGEYFDCHEVLEEIWRSTTPEPKDLFQGLIQVAVGFYHHQSRRRPDVARRVLAKGRRRLEALAPVRCGLDVRSLLEEVAGWEAWLAAHGGEAPEPPRIVVTDPAAVR